MNSFLRKICCAIFCCRCSKGIPLQSLDDNSRLLPKNEKTKGILENNEVHLFGVVPENLRGVIINLTKYTNSFVRKIVCGANHCLILFNDGHLAGFGGNEEGQLGLDIKKFGTYINEIKLNDFSILSDPITGSSISDYDILDIGAGNNFSLILIKAKGKTMLVKFGMQAEDKYRDDIENINVVNIVELDNEEIGNLKSLYVSGGRSMLITESNDIYIGGIDFNMNPLNKYKLLERFQRQIKAVSMGLIHCLILDNDGNLYAIGDNTYGELGLANATCAGSFTKVDLNFSSPIIKITTGARHSMVLLSNGDFYAYGDNSEGQCTGNNIRYMNPIKIEVDAKEKVVDIYSGYNHNMVVLKNGDMYTWGDTSSGKLGYVEGNLIQNIPRIIQRLKGKYPNNVAMGFQMTVISTSTYENHLNNFKN